MIRCKNHSVLSALMLCMGVFFFATIFCTASVSASTGSAPEPLTVDSVWLEGDALHIAVSDARSGANQTLELNLRDYAGMGDEYVTVQAIDRDGNKSNTIQFKNPYFIPDSLDQTLDNDGNSQALTVLEQNESGIPGGAGAGFYTPDGVANESFSRDSLGSGAGNGSFSSDSTGTGAFTPDGTGSVMDNVTTGENKEFFTIRAEDGAVFYLIVDRQRATDNVYFLNAVTENDLLSLAKPGDGTSESAIPGSGAVVTPTPPPKQTEEPLTPTDPTPVPESPAKTASGSMNRGSMIFIVIAALAVGGAGWYFKIYRPKHQAAESDYGEDYDDEPDGSGDYGDSDVYGVSDEEGGGR